MICPNDITNLRTDINEKIGQRIIVKGTHGRGKLFEKEATIEKTYPAFFAIKFDEEERNVNYTYTDILTGEVEVEVFDGIGYSQLVPENRPQKNFV